MKELPDQFSSVGDFVSDLIERVPHVSHLMDTQRKFICSNFLHAQYIGVQSIKDIEGLTGRDLIVENGLWKCEADVDAESFCRWRKWRLAINNEVEHQARISKRPVSIKSVSINHEGFIGPDNMTKFPILDAHRKKVVAILNIGEDLTHQCDFFSLFKLYQQFYSKQKAIELFLKYLKIGAYFIETPSIREVYLLLAMCIDPRYKYVSKILGLTCGTVEVYISKLRVKLVTDLHHILSQLRKMFMNGYGIDEHATFLYK